MASEKHKNWVTAGISFVCGAAALGLICGTPAHATQTQKVETTVPSSPSLWSQIRPKTRVFQFTEVSSPALSGKMAATPTPEGAPSDPINAFTILQADYLIAEDTRLLYFQRLPLNFNSLPGQATGMDLTFSDPRFGLRKTNVIKTPGFVSTIDLYTQPGFSKGSANIERRADVGVQANIKYLVKDWTFANLMDARKTFFGPNGKGNDLSGFFAPNISYSLSSKFSTQTWAVLPWRHKHNTTLGLANFSWNSPGEPFLQNGIGYSATDKIWLGVLVNNFIFTAPRLNNTWTSLWISTTLL